ncbi:complement C4-B-like [Catharus ustulatus]|uniref:complement C4-B-like n=1 Tax=Catharus ustulatus TaxID=91951 RepID=UPI00140B5D2A|nr:complement C4-B-like [Catharus ustulatus]
MERLVLLMSFCLLLSNTQQAPSFLITAPNVVHVGTHETITVQVHGAQSPVQVTAYFKDETKNELLSERIYFNLNQNNGYQEMKKIMVKPGALQQNLFKKSNLPYVLLVTESKELYSTAKSTRILLSSKKGYIFIQTDKPIYTPSSQVRYRIFILDNAMRPTHDTVTVAVLNSKGMVVKKSDRKINAVFGEHFNIPDIAEPGTWKIKAWFQQHEMSNVSAEFEVKRYELPSFEVKLIPLHPYYHIWNESFVFDIEAKHSYGKEIEGAAYVRFGIIGENENKIFIPGLEQQLSIQNGKGRVTLNTPLLEEKLRKSISTLEGFHLYVAVTTVETASGEMREEELSSVKFVRSPYTVDLSNTKKYFVPGAPFSVTVSATSVDGTPAAFLLITATATLPGKPPVKKTAFCNKEGLVSITFDIPRDAQTLEIKVKAEEGKERLESPEASIRAERYQSASPNYLSISIPHSTVAPGDTLPITLNDIHQSGRGNIGYFYYMVVAKGQAELLGRVPSSNKVVNLKITEKMVPAFRFVAYYFVGNEGRQEIVADSVWVDVMDVCEGKIEVTTEQDTYEPTDQINLQIEMDHAGKVALAVVDKAVFILNKKNKLTAKKVFNAMNSYDLGCSVGGGANSIQVFTDVGLAFISDTIQSNIREGYKCLQGTRRQKRSLDFQKKMLGIASRYQNASLLKCCHDGMKLNPMRFSCAKRLAKVSGSQECKNAFQDCCERATALRKHAKQRTRAGLARQYSEQEEFFDETSISLRSYFPESWWWSFEEIESPGKHSVQNFAPDSITTWEVQAISISPEKGFCVAKPHTFAVFKDFFVSLRLPYSVRRHEQLEIKAVVYNYLPNDLQVVVRMDAVKELCTAETTAKAVQLSLLAKGNSATPAFFSVVPLTVGEIPITITAFDRDSGHSDSIRKNLKVVAEGVLQREEETICINSGLKSHTVDLNRPPNMVPGSDSHVLVSLKGNIMDESVENCLSLSGVEKLIQVPYGCAEQTMVKMAPAVYAIEYLDASNQWVNFNPERKQEAIGMVETGYTRLLEFQKEDGSYGAFKTTPSSVWLTAFIVKVLTRSREYFNVQDSHITNSISYLVDQQQADGSFHDHHPVTNRSMQGGIGSAEEDLAMTAFVTIALKHTLRAYPSPDVARVITGAVAYMKNQFSRNTDCYSTVITAYALTLVQSDSVEAPFVKEKLRSCSSFDQAKQQRYWGNGNDAVSVETTAYALLQTLLLEDMEYARPIATWLTERRNYGGGYCSTQDTVVALEALSAYSIQTLDTASTDLTVRLGTPGRQNYYSIVLTDALEGFQKQLEFELGRKLEVSVHGKGNGTMSILKMYWSPELKNNTCNDLILTVEVEGSLKYSEAEYSDEDDYEDLATGENSTFEALTTMDWFDIRSRRKRDLTTHSKTESLQYKVCVRSTGPRVPKMSMVDLTLLSGLEPDTKELEQLVTASDRYIQHFEYKEGKVLLYFGELPSGPDPDCISFGAKQINPMGLVQPANAVLYDFYNPDRRCSVFYSAPKHSAMLSKLCHADVCQCAEGPCPKQKSTFSKALTQATRVSFVCYQPTADYAYEVEILNSTKKNVFDYYEAKIHKILKASADESIQVQEHRQFLSRSSCNLNIVPGKRYLLMGRDGQTVDCNNKMQYLLDAQTWVEKIPENSECRSTLRRQSCGHLRDFLSTSDSLCHV